MMKKGFTLLELVVVIIILGVLATLGFTQYGQMMEKGRTAEAKQIFGDMRKLAIAYRLANGTITGITNADVNVGTNSDQIPFSCAGTHYFRYFLYSVNDPVIEFLAIRCTSNGKSPQGAKDMCILLRTNLATGADTWRWSISSADPWIPGQP